MVFKEWCVFDFIESLVGATRRNLDSAFHTVTLLGVLAKYKRSNTIFEVASADCLSLISGFGLRPELMMAFEQASIAGCRV